MTHTKATAVITIGRNVGIMPVDAKTWRQFAAEVELTFIGLGGELVLSPCFHIEGPTGMRGVWDDTAEDAAVFIGFIDSDYGIRHLTLLLNELRVKYDQEAIGFITLPGINHTITGI